MLVCFELFQALLIWVEKLFMLFNQDRAHPHIYAIPKLGYTSTYAFHLLLLYENQSYLSMLSYIKREAWATEKMRENKRAKSSSVQKEREWVRKRKVALPYQKEAREGKLLKGVPLPPNIPHTCTSWSICMICCSLWFKCLT